MPAEESPGFSIETTGEMGSVVVRATGEIDVATAPRIQTELLTLIGQGGNVTLDLGAVSFIDSSGLGALVTARQRAEECSVSFVLAGRSPAVGRLLQVTGLDAIFGGN